MKNVKKMLLTCEILSFQFHVKASSQTLDVFPFVEKERNCDRKFEKNRIKLIK